LNPKEEQSFWDIGNYLKDDPLVKVDRASMKYSLETRVPLLDMDLIHFSLNLDSQLKTKNGISKYLLKEVLYKHVPKALFDRPKKGFSIPLKNWLLNDLNYLITDYLNVSVIKKHGLVNNIEVQNLINRFYKGENINYNKIWHLIILHWWLELN
jgi:asparagine synthase (glutamine-hydrolysing)